MGDFISQELGGLDQFGIYAQSTARAQIYLSATALADNAKGTLTENDSAIPFGPYFQACGEPPDLVLTTCDRVSFHVHRCVLLHASLNSFGGMLGAGAVVNVPEPASLLRVALHVLYGLPCVHLNASLNIIEGALDALLKYGVAIRAIAAPRFPLYDLVLARAPVQPIEVYALAGKYALEDVAVAASGHLLSYDTLTLSDELSVKMGPSYLKRLFDLHDTRRAALKDIVLKPPGGHAPTAMCHDARSQQQLAAAWAHAAADIAWNNPMHVSTYALQSTFEKAGTSIVCRDCKIALAIRSREAVNEWSGVKRTI